MLVTRTVDQIPPPISAERDTVLAAPIRTDSFEAAFAAWPCLHVIEIVEPPATAAAVESARVVFWNAERLKYPTASAALLAAANADVILLCEVDVGMARSGNRHTVADLATQLATGYAFGTEFVELGLGDARERAWHAGEHNRCGLHGGAILSRYGLLHPAMVRLETSGRWFDGRFGERRVGGRIALMAELPIAGTPVLFVAAHYESHSDQADRLELTRTLLDAVDTWSPGRPALIAGDFNTNTFSLADKARPAVVAAALTVEPDRLVAPMRHEPMFDLLRQRGYDWQSCNVPNAPTQRTRPDGTPAPPFGKIDWLFARGLRCTDPAIIAAVAADGVAISDHEALAVTVTPA